jgi:hypothetical protein
MDSMSCDRTRIMQCVRSSGYGHVGQRGGHHREIAAGHFDRALLESTSEPLRPGVEQSEIQQQMGNGAVACPVRRSDA